MRPQQQENETDKSEGIKVENNLRGKMPVSNRAKQFAPFDAVVGLRAALKEKECLKVPKKILSDDLAEEINRALKNLKTEEIITLIYYDELIENYLQLTGSVTKIDVKRRKLIIGEKSVDFEDIFEIIK